MKVKAKPTPTQVPAPTPAGYKTALPDRNRKDSMTRIAMENFTGSMLNDTSKRTGR